MCGMVITFTNNNTTQYSPVQNYSSMGLSCVYVAQETWRDCLLHGRGHTNWQGFGVDILVQGSGL